MGILQESAIKMGDWVTQPIKAKAVSLTTRRPTAIRKIEKAGSIVDGEFHPHEMNTGSTVSFALKKEKGVHTRKAYGAKRVTWEIEFTDQDNSG